MATITRTTGDHAGHWQSIARQWALVGPPLRPSPQDVAFVESEVEAWVRRSGRAPRVLLLGVTPELCRMAWPAGTDLIGVDRSRDMIDAVWPGPPSAARCADWLSLETVADAASRDVVLCDGGLHLLAHPAEQRALAQSLGRIVAPGGMAILRLFAPPARRESPEAVLADLAAGAVPNLNVLKLRLAMAMMADAATGVELDAVWHRLHEHEPDLEALAARLGWRTEHTMAINSYRGSKGRYHFVTRDEALDLFCSTGVFTLGRTDVPTYELGDRCPTIMLVRTANEAATP